jgi:hypothetical protein
MTADVTSDRRVTVPTLGMHPVFVDGSRLFWALPSPVHEGLGYRVLVPDRIQGDAVLPHASFTAQSRITSRRSCRQSSRSSGVAPCSPSSRRGLAKTALAASRGATASLDDGCARRSCRIKVGTEKRARSNKETEASPNRVHRHACLLTPSLIQGWAKRSVPTISITTRNGGHASLCPPYERRQAA